MNQPHLNRDEKVAVGAGLTMAVLVIGIFMAPFIIGDLLFATQNRSFCLNEAITHPPMAITLRQWLLVDAWTMIAALALLLIAAIATCVSATLGATLMSIALLVVSIQSVFRLAWLIVGAIMFWSDLNRKGTCDRSLTIWMWITLIVGFFKVCVTGFMSVTGTTKATSNR